MKINKKVILIASAFLSTVMLSSCGQPLAYESGIDEETAAEYEESDSSRKVFDASLWDDGGARGHHGHGGGGRSGTGKSGKGSSHHDRDNNR